MVALPIEIDYAKIGMRIRAARKKRKLTQEEVAEACGCSNNHISAVESGGNKPSLDLLIRLSIVLESNLDDFLMDNPSVHPQYLIDARIAPKLSACSSAELRYIEQIIDGLLQYKSEVGTSA